MRAIPVTVIGGYLGAGKTTLVNHLLRNAGGERIAVMVNDFGDVGIDADLIEARDGDVINLAGGCVCCSFGSDLMAALMRVPQMDPPPHRVLLETSGVALPRSVARTVSIASGLSLDAVVVLADAETLLERAADRYVGDTVLAQLSEADLLLLNKVDLVAADSLASLHAWLRARAPRAVVIEARRAQVAPALLYGPARHDGGAPAPDGTDRPASPTGGAPRAGRPAGIAPLATHVAASAFESLSWRFDEAIDVEALAAILSRPELGLARAKGLLDDECGRGWLVQLAGRRVDVVAHSASGHGPGGSIACIGASGPFRRDALIEALRILGPGGPVPPEAAGRRQA